MMKNTTNNALISIQKGSFIYNLFPISTRNKYPIFLNMLLERINSLKVKYNYSTLIKVYENVELNRKVINKELKNKSGIYLWWCKITGLFYIGSAKSFVGRNGRLNDYFQQNRLLKSTHSKISLDIANDMLKYPKSNWTLIILEELDFLENIKLLKDKEQFWMLLIPTYNRSLLVGSNEGLPLSEEKRKAISKLIYIYEITDQGKILSNSEQKIFGIKELSRKGIKSKITNFSISANTWDIKAHLTSGLPFKNKFILSETKLDLKTQLNWRKASPVIQKKSGIWVYDFNSLNLIEHFDSIKTCREKYNISSTTFKRIRKHQLNYKGYLFTNYAL